ncbi:MAG: 50S ribosomal protein L13 [Rickettsia endosymbiont of Platyusa sonomae]|uniref:50S ribosomal protein L13 n=1 Tax=Candidatus Tisiphia endosymbiont of Sialis lutaria TaxID=2029164 RepID=UPI00312C81EF|nr:50S ribosomal protein L13 [Rickettsia endosymbiont of Platyusa sonomae]
MKTYSAKPSQIQKKWWVIDAKDLVLGRLASEVAKILRGKHKPSFTPHLDCGDYVIITNAKHICLTGKKSALKDGKIYYRHTGFPGGIKDTTAGKILAGKYPERVVKLSVKRMITRNVLGSKQMSNLYVYAENEHPHKAQQPEIYDFASKNTKNKK